MGNDSGTRNSTSAMASPELRAAALTEAKPLRLHGVEVGLDALEDDGDLRFRPQRVDSGVEWKRVLGTTRVRGEGGDIGM